MTELNDIDAYRSMPKQDDRPLGPRMAEALAFIETHPGVTKTEVYANCQGYPKPYGGRANYLDRLLRRGLVYDLGRVNRAALYAWLPAEDDDVWHRAHP